MKKITRSTLSLILLFFISSFLLVGSDEEDPLITTWEEPGSGITMQFKDDGNLVISNQKTSLTVAYEKQEPNTLLFTASADGSYPGQTMSYRIEEDRLILSLEGNETVFVKVKK